MGKQSAPALAAIAYLFPAFPVLHQTFVLQEVLGLRARGVSPHLFSLKRPRGPRQPGAEPLIPEVIYAPRYLSPVLWAANLRYARRSLRRYLGAYGLLWEAWRRQPLAPAAARQASPHRWSWSERVRGFYNTNPALYLLKSWLLVPQAVWLGAAMRARGVTHVHAHWATYSTTVALVLRHLYQLPYSFTAHAYDLHMMPRMLPAKVRGARLVLTCARENLGALARAGGGAEPDRLQVIYHGVQLDRFVPAPGRRDGSVFTIVSCGQLESYKGFDLLVEACAQVRRRGHPVRCLIVGDGPRRRDLQRRIRVLGLEDAVQLLGAMTQPELIAVYGQADLMVLATRVQEEFGRRDVIPNVLVEAMAMRIPVVTTASAAMTELVRDGVSGRLVPQDDAAALAAAIEELLTDEALRQRLAAEGQRRVQREFDADRNLDRLVGVFAEYLADHGGVESAQPARGGSR